MIEGKIIIKRAWRSQWRRMIVFALLSIASLALSNYFPASIIHGKLISLSNSDIFLSLPLFSLLPLYGLLNLMLPVFDATFTVDNRGIETRVGILSLSQFIVRIRYEDIRSIELHQSLLERGLNVGSLGIGSAATSTVEIYFDGISSPTELQLLIQQERDRRLKMTSSPMEEKFQAAQ